MLNAIGKEQHWKSLSDETLVGQDASGNNEYEVSIDAKYFGTEGFPITIRVTLLKQWEEKTGQTSGKTYYIGAKGSAIVFGDKIPFRLLAGIGKTSGNKYMNGGIGKQEEYRVVDGREVAPITLGIFEDNGDLTMAQKRNAKLNGIEPVKKENAWKLVVSENYTQEDVDMLVGDSASDEQAFVHPADVPVAPVAPAAPTAVPAQATPAPQAAAHPAPQAVEVPAQAQPVQGMTAAQAAQVQPAVTAPSNDVIDHATPAPQAPTNGAAPARDQLAG